MGRTEPKEGLMMERADIKAFIEANPALSYGEGAKKTGLSYDAYRKRYRAIHPPKKLNKQNVDQPPEEQAAEDTKVHRLQKVKRVTDKKYKALLDENERLVQMVEAVKTLPKHPNTYKIARTTRGRGGEATMVCLASDWHIEEEVTLAQTSGLSRYNLDISRERADHYFKTVHRLVEIERQNTTIKNLVVALLGDFISSDIHDDTSKSALLEPTHAIIRCREYIGSGIKFLLDNTDLKLTVVCHTGNHGRKDKQQLIANEAGSSLEYIMYHYLAADFADEERVTFLIPEGYHSYLDIHGTMIRFHHGHAIRFAGGVGGITIPVRKAISQWNVGRRADIDCFGHFHQAFDGNNFIANGSMIGYSAYGLFVKGEFQRPQQMLFGIHTEHGKFVTRPIVFP